MINIEESFDMIFDDIGNLKLSMENWITKEIGKRNFSDFKIHYLPYIYNIGILGISNAILVHKVKKTRQAVSKVLKELQNNDLVTVHHYQEGSRVLRISLTKQGMDLYEVIISLGTELHQYYLNTIGRNRYNHLTIGLRKLKSFHDHIG